MSSASGDAKTAWIKMVRIVYGLTVIVTMDHRGGDVIAGLPRQSGDICVGGSKSTTGRGGGFG